MICTNVEAGVASPIWNNVTGGMRLKRNARGIRIPTPPIMPCSMTKDVNPIPVKYPVKQNINDVSSTSMA